MSMTEATQSRDGSITSRIVDFIKANPRVDNRKIADAVGAKYGSVCSLTSQMHTSGKLARVPTPAPSKNGKPGFLYEIGDINARAAPARPPRQSRPPQHRTKLAQAVQEAVDQAPTALAQAMQKEIQDDAERRRVDAEAQAIIERAKEALSRGVPPADAVKELVTSEAKAPDEQLDPIGYDMPLVEDHAPPVETPMPPQEEPQEERREPEPRPEPIHAEEAAPAGSMELQPAVTRPSGIATLVPIHNLMDTIAATMVTEIMYRLNIELTRQVADMTERLKAHTEIEAPLPKDLLSRVANAASPVKKRLPAVLIVGLLPSQAGMISEEFGSYFDLRFWKDEAPEMLRHNARGADHVVLFTSKMSHGTEFLLKKMNVPLIKSPGGMTQLRSKLTELFCQYEDAKKVEYQ